MILWMDRLPYHHDHSVGPECRYTLPE